MTVAAATRLDFSSGGINDALVAGLCPRRKTEDPLIVTDNVVTVAQDRGPAAMIALLKAVARDGDRQAFTRLFLHYAPRIKTFLRKLGTEDAVAEELAQEAMLAVWRQAASFDPARANAGTWIFSIARNLRIDRLRKEKRPACCVDGEEPGIDPAPRADDALATLQGERRLRGALAGLPADQAEVVTLSFYEDRPHAEIAARLKIPLGTVKSRLRLAMKRIRAGLGEDPS